MVEQIIEIWEIHDRINLYLLDAIPEESLGASLGKGRTVSDLFAHIHNVRFMWLKAAAPDLLEGLAKLETKKVLGRAELRQALAASGAAMTELLRRGLATGKVKSFKPHPIAFLGYCISHESHHRGHIGWALKHSGHPLDAKTAFGLWEWGVR